MIVARFSQSLYAIFASMNLKLSESVHGCLEDFLEVECLVGDICTSKHTTEKRSAETHKQEQKLD